MGADCAKTKANLPSPCNASGQALFLYNKFNRPTFPEYTSTTTNSNEGWEIFTTCTGTPYLFRVRTRLLPGQVKPSRIQLNMMASMAGYSPNNYDNYDPYVDWLEVYGTNPATDMIFQCGGP